MKTMLPAQAEVDQAIDVLNGSFTYDPPYRWRNAYDFLLNTRVMIKCALRPVATLEIVAQLAFIPVWGLLLFRDSFSEPWLVATIVALCTPGIISVVLKLHVQQRMPVIRRLHSIEEALKPFQAITSDAPVAERT